MKWIRLTALLGTLAFSGIGCSGNEAEVKKQPSVKMAQKKSKKKAKKVKKDKSKKDKDQKQAWMVKQEGDAWKIKGTTLKTKLKTKDDTKYFFKLDDKRYKVEFLSAKNKYKVKDDQKNTLFTANMKEDKIIVKRGDKGDKVLFLHFKGDVKVDVKDGDGTIGKVKFYPDSNTVKAKAGDEKESVCKTKAKKLVYWPAVCLTKGFDETEQLSLTALLFVAGMK